MLVGILVTAIIHSSATDAMVVGFANAGLMELTQAVGVLFGAKIGSTVTALLISIEIKDFVPVCILIGAFIITFSRKNNQKYYGQIVAGFGMMFLGLSLMSSNLSWLGGEDGLFTTLGLADKLANPLIGLLVGIVLTGVIQSSTASIGIIMALASAGAITDLRSVVFVIFGFNVGACSAAFISSLGANRTSKQIALVNFLISGIGATIMTLIAVFLPFTDIVEKVFPVGLSAQIPIVHTIFNIVITVILFPLSNLLVKLTKLILPDLEEEREKMQTVYLDTRILSTPPMAVMQVENECRRLGEFAKKNYGYAMKAFFEQDMSCIEKVAKNEKVIDYLTHEITRYIVKINGLDILDSDRKTMGVMYSAIQDMERIGDHAENITDHAREIIEGKVKFSGDALRELHHLDELTAHILDDGFRMFDAQKVDFDTAKSVIETENSLDNYVRTYKINHIRRMNDGICSAENGTIFLDMLTILERVGDHANNVAFSIPKNKQSAMTRA